MMAGALNSSVLSVSSVFSLLVLVRPIVRKLQVNPEIVPLQQRDSFLQRIAVFAADAYQVSLNRGLCLFFRVFDELYDLIFVRPAKWIGYTLWKKGDGWLIDGFGPDGVSARVLDVTRNVVKIQTGYLYHYAFAMLIGAAGLITWFMFGMGVQ